MGRACACYAAMERSEGRFQFVGRCPDGGPYQDTRAENPRYAQPHYARGYSPGTLCSPAPRFAPSEPSRPVAEGARSPLCLAVSHVAETGPTGPMGSRTPQSGL